MRIRSLLIFALASPLAVSACGDGGGSSAGDIPRCLDLPSAGTGEVVSLQRFLPRLAFPEAVALAFDPSGDRAYLIDQRGLVHRIDLAAGTSDVALDLRPQIAWAPEAGLLGIALHPDFATNRRVFLSYTTPGGPVFRSRISAFDSSDDGRTFDPASEVAILELDQPYENHNGGDIHFGPDGMLYAGFGDGGSGGDPHGNGQNPDVLLGKMLRIDVDAGSPYAIPPDNPFAGGGGRAEVWALGLRNPWRFSFDRLTGDLWAGDVGQNAWEEVDLVQRGGNYGWNLREAAHCFSVDPCDVPGLIDPIAEYENDGTASVVGGHVYRGTAIPGLRGTYLYTDFYIDTLFGVREGDAPEPLIDSTGLVISAFSEDPEGELYVLDYAAGGIHRLVAGQSGRPVPARLSETGCVAHDDPRTPAAGFVPYDVRIPFWSDGADKTRALLLPPDTALEVGADGDLALPAGAVVYKHFRLGDVPVETRFLVRAPDGRHAGYTYRWDDDGRDAVLVERREVTEAADRPWFLPERSDCSACHTGAAGGSLGLELGQLDPPAIDALASAGWLEAAAQAPLLPELDDDSVPVAARARAYLHVNCSHCHRPGGRANVAMDLRATTAEAELGVCDVVPTHGDLGLLDARIVTPGAPERSVLLARMRATDEHRMPDLGTLRVDEDGVALIESWISALPGCPTAAP